ncbi:MAG: tetratricopeptide repeat protein [Elusimicrobiota bacterium]
MNDLRPTRSALWGTFFLLATGLGTFSVFSAPEQKERAVSALEQAVQTDSANDELWLHLGFAYRKVGQMDQAQKAFEKAAALNPRSQDASYMLGLIYESKHQDQDALRAWQQLLSSTNDPAKRETATNHIHHLSQ